MSFRFTKKKSVKHNYRQPEFRSIVREIDEAARQASARKRDEADERYFNELAERIGTSAAIDYFTKGS